jgi:predicted glycoside hydrolase/deacetylase ChbG (UPF0249 family)
MTMKPNPVLKQLGLADDDRAVIIHTDDIGMCQASLAAYADLVEVGLISAASTMVPCSWFPATAEFCRTHPDKVDMGVHITLTSEWSGGYRWGPISTRDPASGLLDEQGYLPYTSEEVQAHATPEAVRREIQAQVERAVKAGIDVTHIDTHMGTVFDPRYLESYVQTALQYRVPPMLVRKDEAGILAMGMGFTPETATGLARHIETLTAMGLPMVDDVTFVPYVPGEDHVIHTQRFLTQLPPGLTYLIIHPSVDTPELRAIIPEGWATRDTEYRTFMDERLHTTFRDEGIHVIGWRVLRDMLRQAL